VSDDALEPGLIAPEAICRNEWLAARAAASEEAPGQKQEPLDDP
jgi:hypothetical protein